MTSSQMDTANRAMCYALRNPPRGQRPTPYKEIQKVVRKQDGTRPSHGAICLAAQTFKLEKKVRGCKPGGNKTSKDEDKVILRTFHKVRPPGHGTDSREIHKALPKKLKEKIGRRTVIRRLAGKGYTPQTKLNLSDPSVKQKNKRLTFGRKHSDKSAQAWKGWK